MGVNCHYSNTTNTTCVYNTTTSGQVNITRNCTKVTKIVPLVTCCLCGPSKNDLGVGGVITGGSASTTVTVYGFTISQSGAFSQNWNGQSPGAICWYNTPSCNSGALQFYNLVMTNTIPDGLKASTTSDIVGTDGTAGTLTFTYLKNGASTTASISVRSPYATLTTASNTATLKVNISAIFLLSLNDASYTCPTSVAYCTYLKETYSANGRPLGDCTTMTNAVSISTNIYYSTNKVLAEKAVR